MPRTKETRNFRGSIIERLVKKDGKNTLAYEVRIRVVKLDDFGQPILNKLGKKTYRDKTVRKWTKTEANIALINLINEVDSEQVAAAPREKNFEDLAEYYRREYVKKAVIVNGRKVAGFKSSLSAVRNHVNELAGHFSTRPLSSITYEDLRVLTEILFQTTTNKGTSPAMSTVNEKLSRLRKMFNVAIQKGWLSVNPFSRGTRLIDRASENRRNRMMTFEEELAIHAMCQPHKMTVQQKRTLKNGKTSNFMTKRFVDRRHIIPYMIAAVDTALRVGEVFNMEPWQVDFENNVIYLTKEAAEKTKTGMAGIVPMSTRLRTILLEIKERSSWHPNMKIFPKITYDRSFNSACKEAGIEDLQFRDLRSTGATRMVLAGGATSQVMKITRHSPESIRIFLEHYTNVDVQNAQLIGNHLDKFIENESAKVGNKVGDDLHVERNAA